MTDNAVTKLKTPPHEPTMVERAIAAGASIETIEKVMGMQERWEANQSRKAFNTAVAEFKKNPPQILKTSEVSFGAGKTSYRHEDLAEMLAAVDPALAAHGLWVRFKIHSAPGAVTVTCVIGHADGHSEEPASLTGAPDTSGNKNAIQAIGSTVSYLQRYTLKAALGMAAARDDDGVRSGAKVLTEAQAGQITKALEVGDIDGDKLLEKLNESLEPGMTAVTSIQEIPEIKFHGAMGWIKKAVTEGKYKRKGAKK